MEITEEQKKRAEVNRQAALEKLNRALEARRPDPWCLFRCKKVPHSKPVIAAAEPLSKPENLVADRFCISLEIFAPDAFSVTSEPLAGFPFPGKAESLQKIDNFISSSCQAVPLCCKERKNNGRASIYMLKDYDVVCKCLKKFPGIQLQEIPWKTAAVIRKISHSYVSNHWSACFPSHQSDDEVDELIKRLPVVLQNALLPFQMDGVRYGLRRGGRCLLADEMGLGKTIQAIAIASCFMDEGSALIVCPAVLRFSWAEELERWLPFCLPSELHLVFGHKDNLTYLTTCPKVVVISYTMLHRLRKSMLEHEWALMIVDESHNLRCTKKAIEADETQTVLDMASKVKRLILLSGTPSLSRPFDIFHQINILWPGLLGKDKYEFAENYCSVKFARGSQGKVFKDFSNGIRLEELNVLLRQTVMVRRLKDNVLVELPPKRRQVIRLKLKGQDIRSTIDGCREVGTIPMDNGHKKGLQIEAHMYQNEHHEDGEVRIIYESRDPNDCRSASQLSYQELGIAKLSGFREWLSNHSIVTESEAAINLDSCASSQKTIIFAHHIKVLDGVQEFLCEKQIGFVRIDGRTLARDRQAAVQAFRSSPEVKIALIGITAGGVGLDFSSAKNVVFVELPKSASEMLQAEDRAHRRGQTNAVNIYIFCAKDSLDESHWRHLNRSLSRVSSMMNGKEEAVQEIEVDKIYNLSQIAQSQKSDTGAEARITDGKNCARQTNKFQQCSSRSIVSQVEGVDAPEMAGNFIPDLGTCDTKTYALVSEVNGESPELAAAHDISCSSQEVPVTSSLQMSKMNAVEITSTCNADINTYKKDLMVTTECKTCFLSNEEPKFSETLSVNSTEHNTENRTATAAEVDDFIQADSLRFEVSQYTGRVHLYACIVGKDSRPRPLLENFRQEELESSLSSLINADKETTPKLLKENSACRNVLLEFIKEWNNLRPIEQKKLRGKPLQLPLELELCYLKQNLNHGSKGLLKGGSKRRVTPLDEISNPLPENAVWKKILLQKGSKRGEKEYLQAWSLKNEPLCKLCQSPCCGSVAKTPQFFEDLFCNLNCYEEYRIRTSQRYLREALFQIEFGVCTQCKLDCHKLVQYIRPLSIERRREHIEKVAPKVARNKKLLERLIYEPTQGNAWHADHMVPVFEGGGECRLENMRTLCVACHSEVTAAQQAERRLMRIKAKEQLKSVIKELQQNPTEMETIPNVEGQVCLEGNEDELLIRVPGSAYSGDQNTEQIQ
ncbi:uncharacterized protein [Aristolochia californica]|uniref:uncharacterized protein n=1 Tax=Aristolochia californica TaxID=171875 RepID=UPI0035D9AEE6